MRVALVTDGVHPYVIGGMQRHSRALAEHLVGHGVDVDLFHTTFDPARSEAAASLHGFPEGALGRIRNHFVPYPPTHRYPGHYLVEQHAYSRRCLESYLSASVRADFIYAQGLTGLAFESFKQRGGLLPPIGINTHGYEMFQMGADWQSALKQRMLRPAFRRVNRRADFVFSFSGKIAEIVTGIVGVDPDKVVLVPNAISAAWIREGLPPSSSRRAFLFVGRDDRRKGLPELLEACRHLPASGWSLDVVGPVKQPPRLGMPNIRFRGAITDTVGLQGAFDACDCIVCPSYAEGMPTVVLEAMARGLAVIATDVGATREIVDSANGVLLPGPGVDSLAAAMAALIHASPKELDRMKRASLERSSGYTWEEVTARLIEQIRVAIQGSR